MHVCVAYPRVLPVVISRARVLHSIQRRELLRAVANTMAGSSAGGAAVTVHHDAQPMVRLHQHMAAVVFQDHRATAVKLQLSSRGSACTALHMHGRLQRPSSPAMPQ